MMWDYHSIVNECLQLRAENEYLRHQLYHQRLENDVEVAYENLRQIIAKILQDQRTQKTYDNNGAMLPYKG